MEALFWAIADPTRHAILDEPVARDEQSLYELSTRLVVHHATTSTRQAISQHLGVLEDADLVRSHRAGRTKVHHLNTAGWWFDLERAPGVRLAAWTISGSIPTPP